jgi:hypothetical protein
MLTGTYLDCDNVIHDKYALAENRSPSDCEMKFDRMVRDSLAQAFRPVVQFLQAREWTLVKQSQAGPITAMARHTESKPYRLDSAHEGTFFLEFQSNAAMAQYQQRMNALTQQLADQIRAGKLGGSNREIEQAAYEMQGAMRLRIVVGINAPTFGLVSFSGGHTALPDPHAAYAMTVSHVQAATGGGAGASHDESVYLLGNWSAPATQAHGDGSENISAKAALNNTAQLTVQNIFIRIQANPANARQAAAQIDFASINRLLQQR